LTGANAKPFGTDKAEPHGVCNLSVKGVRSDSRFLIKSGLLIFFSDRLRGLKCFFGQRKRKGVLTSYTFRPLEINVAAKLFVPVLSRVPFQNGQRRASLRLIRSFRAFVILSALDIRPFPFPGPRVVSTRSAPPIRTPGTTPTRLSRSRGVVRHPSSRLNLVPSWLCCSPPFFAPSSFGIRHSSLPPCPIRVIRVIRG